MGPDMSARRRKRDNAAAAGRQAAEVQKGARPALSRRRKWLLRVTVMVAAPLVFLAALEAGLRLGGYGRPTAFFIGPDADGVYMPNPRFGWRFFPRAIARKPDPHFLASEKAPNAVRVFVLGSSAAQGVPNPSFSFSRILDVMLRERYPDRQVEVINAAMTAINSHVSLEIARDCAAHKPDLYVVYMGNNEVVGPYGPGTVFQRWSPSRNLIRANVWLKSTRTGQLLGEAMDWLSPRGNSLAVWQGMEMFQGKEVAADDRRLQAVYDNYRRNLEDVCSIAHGAGAKVVLSTLAVNLADCPPLASLHRSGLSSDELANWQSLYAAGAEWEKKGKWSEALVEYQAAAQMDDRFAELRFRLGHCLAATGRSSEARDEYLAARDLDALRFRADSRINAVVREVASQRKAAGVRLFDAEQILAESDLAPGGVPGGSLFYEHVHLTFDGNYLLARQMLDCVSAALPQLAASGAQGPVPSRDRCAKLLAMTPWDECGMAGIMRDVTARPPFTNQFDHAVRQAAVEERVEELRRLLGGPRTFAAAREIYEEALERMPDDWQIRFRFGQLALANGQPRLAAEQFKLLRKKLAYEASLYDELGRAAQACGQVDEAIINYRKAIEIDPTISLVHNNLGALLKKRGQMDEAIAEYRKAIEIEPGFAAAHFNLGVALDAVGRTDEAFDHYRLAAEADPELVPAHVNLADSLRSLGRMDDAIAEYRKALDLDPKSAPVHFNLAVALSDHGRLDEAIAHFQAALQLDPSNRQVRANLVRVLKMRESRTARTGG
jgi:tetratricopeptide (TPR) repeat protein